MGGLPTQVPIQNSITTRALWQWSTATNPPVVTAYDSGKPTKTGLMPDDLITFIGVPLQTNTPTGPSPLCGEQVLQIIRQAEDWVEQNSGILLSRAWLGSPPVGSSVQAGQIGITTTSPSGGQFQGIDFDVMDIGYDFVYRKFLMEGWGITQLRYRPLKFVNNLAFIYPLLSQFFVIPLSWVVQDQDAAMVRMVPATNIQMLPLFAMQLTFMGFAQTVPQALWFQYVAGLDSLDYASRYAFMKTLVLSEAAVIALGIAQGSVNFGAIRQSVSVDGLRYDVGYPTNGAAYSGLIMNFKNQRDDLLRTAIDLVRGGVAFVSA